MAVAILTHDAFPDRAKTAVGLLRYGDRTVRALVDRERAGQRVHDALPDVQDAPIVASMADAPDVDALVIGISPIGGEFDESWRADVRTALERGCDVVSGLHHFLSEDEEFATLAAEHGCDLLTVAAGQTTPNDRAKFDRDVLANYSEQIRNEIDVPTMSTNHIKTTDDVNSQIGRATADLCAWYPPQVDLNSL